MLHMVITDRFMKYKKFIICAILIIVSAIGGFFVRWHFFENDILTYAGTARLTGEGSDVDIFTTNEESGTISFLFQYSSCEKPCVFTSLTVRNAAIDFPTYRIEKGIEHDWFVVTTLKNWGTGLIERKDTWYMPGYGRDMLEVLSYTSFSGDYSVDGVSKKEISTDVSLLNDEVVDIIFTTKSCDKNNVCDINTETKHYIWFDGESGYEDAGFVLSGTNS
jgi:hypothetical protein